MGASVSVSADMRLGKRKQVFPANSTNKLAFINLLSDNIVKAGVQVEHTDSDAYYKMCKLACLSATTKPTAVGFPIDGEPRRHNRSE